MAFHWSTLQLTEYLVSVSSPPDLPGALRVGLERAIESVDAEAGLVMSGGRVVASIGFGARGVPEGVLDAVCADAPSVTLDRLGVMYLACADLDKSPDSTVTSCTDRLVVARLGQPCTAEEVQMLHAFALVLGLVRHNLRTLNVERVRHRLVNTLLSIQRAISARHPLQELLDAVTEGAAALLKGAPVALLLVDPATPGALFPASTYGVEDLDEAMLSTVQHVMTAHASGALPPLQGVIASPVVVDGASAGCLIARLPGSESDSRESSELLAAFAQQVSLALTDARTMDAVREAHRDPVTGLPNRRLLLQRLDRERRIALAAEQELCVLFIDLDRFKAVNDTLGHQAGDQLLAQVAQRIGSCVRTDELTARLGGDEFAVVLPNTDLASARRAGGRIITALMADLVVSGRAVTIGASVGVARLTCAHADSAALLGDADVAMYWAKRAGRGQVAVFEPKMLDEVSNELSLRTDIAHALDAGQLSLLYQPIVRLARGEVVGAEALMRWTHPVRGNISPDVFIPIAEQTNVILSLGQWALESAIAQSAAWRAEGADLQVNVNVSPRQIVDPALPGLVGRFLDGYGVPAEVITLEITESSVLVDVDAIARLTALKQLGVRIAIDDFGTGYSSMSYLRRFPVDIVKIDRSFVKDLHLDSKKDLAVIESLVTLCDRLQMQLVAEGIENQAQLDVLKQLGCEFGQGYLFARPLPPAQWPRFLTPPVGTSPARRRSA